MMITTFNQVAIVKCGRDDRSCDVARIIVSVIMARQLSESNDGMHSNYSVIPCLQRE